MAYKPTLRMPLPRYRSTRRDPLTEAYNLQNLLAQGEGESRYLDTLGGRQGTRGRVLGDLATFGQSRIDDVNRSFADDLAAGQLSLANRGLGGSTLSTALTNDNQRQRQAALTQEQDAIINRRTGADSQLSDEMYDLMERRTDQQPDFNQLAKLQQGLGGAGYAAGNDSYSTGRYGGIGSVAPGFLPPIGAPVGGTPIATTGGGTSIGTAGGTMAGTPGPGFASAQPVSNATTPIGLTGGQNALTTPGNQLGGSPYGQYLPPQGAGGLDDPTGSALARYNVRQGYNSPYLGGRAPGMGGMRGPTGRPVIGGILDKIARQEAAAAGAPTSNAYAYNQKMQKHYAKPDQANAWLFQNEINPGYRGFGHNEVQRVAQIGKAPRSPYLPYENPLNNLPTASFGRGRGYKYRDQMYL